VLRLSFDTNEGLNTEQMSRITEVQNSLLYTDIVAEKKLDITSMMSTFTELERAPALPHTMGPTVPWALRLV
jgi:hypothetical protein